MTDLTYRGVKFDLIPIDGMQKTSLRTAVASAIGGVQGGVHAVMSYYSSDIDMLWSVPPKLSEPFREVPTHLTAPSAKVTKPYVGWKKALAKFIERGGHSGELRAILLKYLGPIADSYLLFDKSNTCPFRFGAEYALAVSGGYEANLVTRGDSFCTRTVVAGEWKAIGVIDGRLEGYDGQMTGAEIFAGIRDSREEITSHRFGICDRIRGWAYSNFEAMEDIDGLVMAVHLLKLSMTAEEEQAFEQQVRLTPTRASSNPLKANVPHNLAEIMVDTWYRNVNDDPQKALHDVFSMFVPDHFDSEMFKSYMKVLPTDKKLTKAQIEAADRGVTALRMDIMSYKGK